MDIKVVEGPICPRCGQDEVLLGGTVRPFKVGSAEGWASHCDQRLRGANDKQGCGTWFLEDGRVETKTSQRGYEFLPLSDPRTSAWQRGIGS